MREKWKESFSSVLPLALIVLVITFMWVPVPVSTMLTFIASAVLLVVGMGLFTLGTELSMTPIGSHVGIVMTRSRKLWIVLGLSLFLGIIITVSEPDLTVLASQVPGVPDQILILSVAIGVGLFLMLALIRILFRIKISTLLLISYSVLFLLCIFVPESFLALSFDAGGVTTGPMTVPFILAFGAGIGSIRSDSNAENDSFGLVALSSVGPIIAVIILSLLFHPDGATYSGTKAMIAEDTCTVTRMFTRALPEYMKEVAFALCPIALFFLFFQIFALKLTSREVLRISFGLLYTYLGLSFFLTGVNVGFLPMGSFLGEALGMIQSRWLLVPLGALMGYFVVNAEPAVHVLSKQVFELSAGAIPAKTLRLSMAIGVAVSLALSMLRILLGLPILCLLVPGYLIALVLMFFVPPIFTSIAFDSGGVASGPMTATFLLPMAIGVCNALGRDITQYAFGVVAMVAMTPLITIQLLGLLFRIKQSKESKQIQPTVENIIE